MPIELTVDSGPIYFVSDVHLGAEIETHDISPRTREDWLLELLAEVPGRAAALFVLGDLFDFWFEYRHAIPKGTFRIARALANAVDSGIPVVFLGGNHDFWVGSYLAEEVGLRMYLEPIEVRLHGRRIRLAHGDGLGPGDGGYKVLKRVLRNPLAIAGYRSLHPDLGIPLGWTVSSTSRKHTKVREVLLGKILRDVALPTLRGDVEAMVMGHVHEPAHFRSGGREFLIIGDWIEKFTHVRMIDGQFELYRRRPDGGHDRIPAEPFPDDRRPEPFDGGARS